MKNKKNRFVCNNCGGVGRISPRPLITGLEGYQSCPICDGCGWKKEIIYVDDFGKGFCHKCLKENEKN